MSKYEVKSVVCDYGVFEDNELKLICNSHANALKIKEILETDSDMSKPYVWQDKTISVLEAKLAEKDEELENLKQLVKAIDTYNQYSNDAKKLIILNPDNCYVDGHQVVFKTNDQDKINYAVEQINKIKNDLYENEKIYIRVCDFDEIDNIFDNQIKKLKEGK